MRQVKYSLANENCLDLVLFLNGVPVATVELKTDFTQSVQDAIDQYRFDRNPEPKGQGKEPLLAFPQGALVHFAVSNQEAHMTTRLRGPVTEFLPFNLGNGGGKGNPPNPNGGHRTAYLWEQVWERASWLEIIGRYLIGERDKKQQPTRTILPRYHQLDVTRKLQAAVLRDGAGANNLIQHSAGSGKTNSTAWKAHFFAEVHDPHEKKVFDTVLVVDENERRKGTGQKALFLLYDQVYWTLTFGGQKHVTPIELVPACAPYVILLDAISKSFAATGMRVGWAVASPAIIARMRDYLGHVGAWAPRAEQIATAQWLDAVEPRHAWQREYTAQIQRRLDALYHGFRAMAAEGLPIDVIEPQGAIYLSVRFDCVGTRFANNEELRRFLLERAGMAVVPFQA
ncbi:MAG: aminotransferase class I/II-fold pyridoxal phosphate-dependent enzyme, partial [Planctomycetota bacterium]